jgi:hypothetical protein
MNLMNARFRVEGVPEGATIPGGLSAQHFLNGSSFSFITDVGNVDVRKSVDGIGNYSEVLKRSREEVFGNNTIRLLSVEGLIVSKRAMGRPRDQAILPELEMMEEAEEIRKESESGER